MGSPGEGEGSCSRAKMKRLTLDLPEGLHRAIKRRAVEEGVTMVDMLRTLLEQQYGAR
jgi:predicted DNA binding CopG/RHH family protein